MIYVYYDTYTLCPEMRVDAVYNIIFIIIIIIGRK